MPPSTSIAPVLAGGRGAARQVAVAVAAGRLALVGGPAAAGWLASRSVD